MSTQASSVWVRPCCTCVVQDVWRASSRSIGVTRRRSWLAVGFFSIAGAAMLTCSIAAWAQETSGLAPEIEQRIALYQQAHERMPDAVRKRLSGSASSLLHVVEEWDAIKSLLRGAAEAEEESVRQIPEAQRETTLGPVGDELPPVSESFDVKLVSDPTAIEDQLSSFGGFTQSETDTAECDDTLVVGFNDSGSFIQTLIGGVAPSGSFSFNGWSRSEDFGDTFEDRGILLADPLPAGILFRDLGGDPLIECADADTFYYGSLATDFPDDFANILSGISVSKSADGGRNFGGAVMAVSKDGFDHFLDKPWMAVDPTDPRRIYVTYTDFEFSFSSAACGEDLRAAIELVVSRDEGETWTDPLVIAEVCGSDFVQGSQVVVGPAGEVYVAWEDFQDDIFGPRQILVRRSDDAGAGFDPVRTASSVTPVGDRFLLKGFFRAAFEFPSMAVDRSRFATRGNVYIAWSDGRRDARPDPLFGDVYRFADILISRSTDGGETWSAPVLVNDDGPQTRENDQYQPAVAVDHKRATVGACFYDRREKPGNSAIDRFCATSDNAGRTWTNLRVTGASFAPVPAQDTFVNPVYMGDYDTLASDFTRKGSDFFGAWGDNIAGNPDIRGSSISRTLILTAGR